MTWRWKIAIGIFMVYSVIARYCDFKLAIGVATKSCGCDY